MRYFGFLELEAIKEVLSDNKEGSKIFERAISVRASITKKRYKF